MAPSAETRHLRSVSIGYSDIPQEETYYANSGIQTPSAAGSQGMRRQTTRITVFAQYLDILATWVFTSRPIGLGYCGGVSKVWRLYGGRFVSILDLLFFF